MRHVGVFIVCILSVLAASNAASVVYSGLIVYNNDMNTVLTSNGDGAQTSLAPYNACAKTQEWVYDSDGYIYRRDNNSLVLDVRNSGPSNGEQVIMWYKKTGTNDDKRNQMWNVQPDRIQTRLPNGFYLRKSSTSFGVIMSSNTPVQMFQFMQPTFTCPSTCTSHGDPHFTAWNQKKFDFQSANTVLLANYSGNRVYAVQWPCNTGVTCNEGFVVHPAGTTQTFQLTGTDYAYHNKTRVTVPMGQSMFGIFNVTRYSKSSFAVFVPSATITHQVYYWQGVGVNYVNLGVTITGPAVPGNSLCQGPANGQNPHTFGSQFLVPTQNGTAYQYVNNPYTYDPNYVPNYGPYPPANDDLVVKTQQACSVITNPSGPFAACHPRVAPDYYYGTCVNDSYAMGNETFAQQSIDAYSLQCTNAAKANGTTFNGPTSPSTTTIEGPSMVPVGTRTFTIVARDVNGMMRMTGGDSFTVTGMGPGMSTPSYTLMDNGNGTYTVTWVATMEGNYTWWVSQNGRNPVSNSPYMVTAYEMTSANTTSVALGPYTKDMTSSFTIVARTASGADRMMGGDTFLVNFPPGSADNIVTTDNMDGTYTVSFVPRMTGRFNVDVSFMGMNIKCSQYTVLVKN